ncbi:hypothetical protein HY025_01810 [Candidatus Daviesbacteria bacterium]|nr:hypothetical protein [Candidatus Daviesbacteria bacterium]
MKFGEPIQKIEAFNISHWKDRPIKVVVQSGGNFDVCPFPETHFDELCRQAEQLRYRTPINKYFDK